MGMVGHLYDYIEKIKTIKNKKTIIILSTYFRVNYLLRHGNLMMVMMMMVMITMLMTLLTESQSQ